MSVKKLSVKIELIDEMVRITDANGLFIEFPWQELDSLIDMLCHYQWLGRSQDV